MHHLFAILALCFSSPAFSEGVAKHVLLISIDGGKARTVEKSDLPVIHELAEKGAVSWGAQTIASSITLPSHSSMISGVDVNVHGMSWNGYDASRATIKVPTIFSEAKRAGLKTALFAAKEKFRHLNSPGALDKFTLLEKDAPQVASAAALYWKKEKPGILMVHFADADGAGHSYGWDSPEFIEALKQVDKAVMALEKAVTESGLGSSTLILITADHGGSGKNHGQDIPEHREIPWIASGAGVKPHFTLSAKISTMDTAATILWALGLPVPASWQGKAVQEAFK